jgi:hypothetical protein
LRENAEKESGTLEGVGAEFFLAGYARPVTEGGIDPDIRMPHWRNLPAAVGSVENNALQIWRVRE